MEGIGRLLTVWCIFDSPTTGRNSFVLKSGVQDQQGEQEVRGLCGKQVLVQLM